jgi:hypothetical protein
MAEAEKTKGAKTKGEKAKGGDNGAASRSLSSRIERSLKDVDRLMNKSPDASPQQKAMAQLEQAKVSALLQLADSIRESRKDNAGAPQA